MQVTEKDTQHLLTQAKDPAAKKMADDIGLVIALTKVLNASLALGDKELKTKLDYGLALAGKGLAQSELVQGMTNGKTLQAVNTIAGVALSNKALVALSNASPAKAGATVALVAFEKLFLVGGLQEKHKCMIAVGSLATTTGLTIVSAPTGIGLAVGVIGVLAAAADAMNKCSLPN